MLDKAGVSGESWCKVKTFREASVTLKGLVKIFMDGREIGTVNTCTTTLKNQLAKAGATGAISAVDKFRLTFSDVTTHVGLTTILVSGLEVDYSKWRMEYHNTSGVDKTINSADLGYDLDGAGEAIYAQVTGLSIVVPDNHKIAFEWTITVSLGSGGITDNYRYLIAGAIALGELFIPNNINFVETPYAQNLVTCTLESGGTGAENFFQYTATFTATGDQTIDILELGWKILDSWNIIFVDDIVDKTLSNGEQLEGHMKITIN